ncbi:hypothetical protein GOB57_08735 [Sinorhizobium meliloti]|nr:hypothetical protein [Sinorhizobium meliloti]
MGRYGGKYWSVGLGDRSRLGATDAQLRYLKSLFKRDFRGEGLTQGQASDLIEQGLEQRAKDRSELPDIVDQMFSLYMKRAIEAANAAGDKWLAEHPEVEFVVSTPEGLAEVRGPIGRAFITAPKKGSGLAKWMSEHGLNDRRDPKALAFHYKYQQRLEGELQLACCIAALEVLMEARTEIGDIRVNYRCDDENFRLAAAA